MKRVPIGIIDSGLGGLTVWRSIRRLLPNESTIFVGDHAFVPYGTKSKAWIRERMLRILINLRAREVKLIVVACNTATVAGIDRYREKMPEIPIIGVVPVIKTAAEVTRKRKFVVISTPFTTRSPYQKDLIAKFARGTKVYTVASSQLVELVEQGKIAGSYAKKILKLKLDPFLKKGIDVVVLGSTHFAFLNEIIHAIVGRDVAVLDSGGAVARHVKRVLEARGELSRANTSINTFYTTGDPDKVTAVAKKLIGRDLEFLHADI